MKAKRVEIRKRFIERVADEGALACYCYVAESDKKLTQAEIGYLRDTFPAAADFSSPTKEALSRKVRAYIVGGSPTLAERRRLRNALTQFAGCDGPLTADERDALGYIENLLGLAKTQPKSTRTAWGPRRATVTRERSQKTESSQAKTRAKVEVKRPPLAPWCYEYLGCSETDSDEVIKRCYRQLAVKLHPDKHASRAKTPQDLDSHVQAFQKLQAAYAEVWSLRGKPSVKR